MEQKELNIEEQLAQLGTETDQKGERYYARKFKQLYTNVRKGLVLIAKERNKSINNERAYNLARGVLNHNLTNEELEKIEKTN